MSDVITGEAVPLELRVAKLPSRALAIIIDAAVYAAIGLALFILVGTVIPAVDTALATALGLAAVITMLVAVPTAVETLTRGRSVGKLALGLRVVRDDGGAIRARHALVRALAGVFADFVVTLGVGAVFCSMLNERGKRIGDVLAGTLVLRERVPASSGLPPMPPQLASWASGLELSQLPDDLALSARSFVSRLPQLSPQVRDDLGARLADQVATVVSPPPPADVPAWAYLVAVLNERARRDAARLSQQAGTPGRYESGTTEESSRKLPPDPPQQQREPDHTPEPDQQQEPGKAPDSPPAPRGGGFVPPS
ncbi:RDD family protein [Phytoactinopolyspora halophila]|nr:RDD family protein [Phytoactinopolyspora halophila]